MSGINSIQGAGTDIYYQQLVSQLNQGASSQASGSSGILDATESVPAFSSPPAPDSDQWSSLRDQIREAIEEAVQGSLSSNASTSEATDSETSESSDSTATDLMSIIKETVDKVLQENGINPEEMDGRMPPPPGPPPELDSGSLDITADSSNTTDSTQSLLQSLQMLIAQLQGNQTESGALSGYLFDQQG